VILSKIRQYRLNYRKDITLNNDTLIPLKEVKKITSLSGPTIWRMRKKGAFPQNVKISDNRVAWSRQAIQKWITEKTGGAES